VSHSRGHIAYCPFSPPVAHSLNEAMREKTSQPVLFVDTHPSQCWLQVFSRGIWPGKIVEQVFSRIRLVYVEGVCCVCVGFHRTPQQQQPLASPNWLLPKAKRGPARSARTCQCFQLPTACFADGAGLGGSCQRAPLAPWRRLLVDQHLRYGHNFRADTADTAGLSAVRRSRVAPALGLGLDDLSPRGRVHRSLAPTRWGRLAFITGL
jgi:hypothetical protein